MLSYRHAYHAGNHADVLKHLVLVALLRHLNRKDKPYVYVDTHAGAGRYALSGPQATQTGESATGIGRLWDAPGLAGAAADYLARVRALNPAGTLVTYPGSPLLAGQLLRPGDRMCLCERHPADLEALRAAVRGLSPGVAIEQADGFAALRALLPPAERRGLVMIDPAYEDKADYGRVVDALREVQRRFATGVCLIWLPMLARLEARELPRRLQRAASRPWLYANLQVRASAPGGGLHGSGVFVLNPPWTLADSLSQALPSVARLLGQDAEAGFGLAESGAAAA